MSSKKQKYNKVQNDQSTVNHEDPDNVIKREINEES